MNKRRVKPYRVGTSLVIVIPKDWAAGMDVSPGDELEMFYDGEIRVRKPEAPS